MVNVLAFDCAGCGSAVAVVRAGQVAAGRTDLAPSGQAERLMPMIETVCADAGTSLSDLDLIAVTIGPGSFTGIRIGLAAARGLALATGLPCVGVTSFEAVAASVPPHLRPLVVTLDSRRKEIFVQCFAENSEAGAPMMLRPEDAARNLPQGQLWVAGDAAALLIRWLVSEACIVPGTDRVDPAAIAALAAARWRADERPSLPRPLYLRAPDTTLQRSAGRR